MEKKIHIDWTRGKVKVPFCRFWLKKVFFFTKDSCESQPNKVPIFNYFFQTTFLFVHTYSDFSFFSKKVYIWNKTQKISLFIFLVFFFLGSKEKEEKKD